EEGLPGEVVEAHGRTLPSPRARRADRYSGRKPPPGGDPEGGTVADANRKILAASFETPDGGTRAAGAIGGALPDKIGNTAVLHVRPDGKAKFIESKDWGAGRGALLGGVIGIIGGPIGIVAGGAIGGLAAELRGSGLKNRPLQQLRESPRPGHSAPGVRP